MIGPMMLTRRRLLSGSAALLALAPAGALAQASAAGVFVNAADFGLVSNPVPRTGDPTPHDQSARLQEAVNAAAAAMLPLFIPGGFYGAANLSLPAWITVVGVRGGTHLQAIGDQPILVGDTVTTVTLRDLVFDGLAGGGNDGNPGLVVLRDCDRIEIDGVRLVGGMNGAHLERCSGRVANLEVEAARDNGLFALALVAGNFIAGSRADGGGNGQNGNGINVYRADAVVVRGNRLMQCAFSAVRLNASQDTIVSENVCLDSGEVAIFSEFGFSGSVIADNVVDRAAQGISITNFNDGGRLATCTGNVVRNIAPRSLVNPDTTPAGIFAGADAGVAHKAGGNGPGVGGRGGRGP